MQRVSADGGATWAFAKELGSDQDWFDYSSLAVAADGTILCLANSKATSRGAAGFNQADNMALFRCSVGWLTDGAIVMMPRRRDRRGGLGLLR